MKVLTLQRFKETQDGTPGMLFMEDGYPFCATWELQWKLNKADLSCIPPGEFMTELYNSPKFGYKVYRLLDVPNRDFTEIHVGNTIVDIQGCILLGMSFGIISTSSGLLHGVVDSKIAFNRFMAQMANDNKFKLVVLNA